MVNQNNKQSQTGETKKWQAHLSAQAKSGLSRPEYCRRRQINGGLPKGHPPAFFTPALTDVQARFAEWRKTIRHRSRIPKDLWAAAVMLSNEHSIHKISRALRLNHTELKERIQKLQTTLNHREITPALDFIPIDITPTHPAECIVEMEHCNGNKMRMHFKGKADLDLQSFAESFWGERE